MLRLRIIPASCFWLQFTVLGAGCPSAATNSTSSTSSDASTTSPTSTMTSAGVLTTDQIATSESGAQTVTDADTAGTTLQASCGDGAVGADETCDDGNGVNGDGCNVDCRPSAEMLWDYRSGLPNDDLFFNVAVNADGSIFAGGVQPNPSFDRWLSRFADDGDIVWSRTYPESGFDYVIDVAVSDRIYAAGSTKMGSNRRAWIAGLSLDGEASWSDEVISDYGDAYASSVATTPEGDAVFTGLATGEDGQAELWTRRYGADGMMQWTQSQVISDKPMHPLGPAVTAASDQIVVGYYTAAPLSEMLLSYSPIGGDPLFKALPTNESQILGIARDAPGNILTAGREAGSGLIVRRFASDAKLLWSNKECEGSAAHSIAVDSQGDVVVIGYGPGQNLGNIRLCKYSAEGTLRWGKDIDGGGEDAGYGVAIMPNDRIVACGHMWTENAGYDAWLAVFAP